MKKINEKILRWLFLLAVAISFCVNYGRLFDRKLDTNGDNYQYYLLAHSLATGQGYVSDIGPVPTPHTHFPPGYPAFMSLFLRIFPDNIVAMKCLNGALLLISLLLLFRIVRKTTGKYGLWYALFSCLLLSFHSELLRWSTILMSEMLYLAVSLGIIALCVDLDLEQLQKKDWRQIARLIGICLLIAAAYLVRTMGITLILATALAFAVLAGKRLLHRKTEGPRWIMPAIVCGLILLSFLGTRNGWNLRNQRVSPGWESDYLSYFSVSSSPEEETSALAPWFERVGDNLKKFVPYYIPQSILNPDQSRLRMALAGEKTISWVKGILIIAVILVGLLSMKGLQVLLIAYFLITFGVLVLYPPQFADTRYFIPLIPLMVAASVVGIAALTGWLWKKLFRRSKFTWPAVVAAGVLTAILLPTYLSGQKFYRLFASFKSYAEIKAFEPYQQYADACEQGRNFSSKRLAAVVKPEIYYVLSDYHHAISLPRSGSPDEIISFLEKNRVEIIIVDSWFPASYRVILPTILAYPKRFTILWQEGPKDRPTYLLRYMLAPSEK